MIAPHAFGVLLLHLSFLSLPFAFGYDLHCGHDTNLSPISSIIDWNIKSYSSEEVVVEGYAYSTPGEPYSFLLKVRTRARTVRWSEETEQSSVGLSIAEIFPAMMYFLSCRFGNKRPSSRTCECASSDVDTRWSSHLSCRHVRARPAHACGDRKSVCVCHACAALSIHASTVVHNRCYPGRCVKSCIAGAALRMRRRCTCTPVGHGLVSFIDA
jgi:hypothetical protein